MNTLAKYWEKLDDKKVRCTLCPHRCIISEGQMGVCGVRKNIDGKLYTQIYGRVSSIAPDPIEKKPLFHFYPGSTVLSFGSVGCNMRCLHCQNWEISQLKPEKFPFLREITPETVERLAMDYDGIAWTYNEPTIWHEFTVDASKLVKKHGKYVVYVTNGYINEEPLRELAQYLDAMNIDVKAFSDDFYRKISGARLEPVLKTVELAHSLGIHIELTYLIIPSKNDSDDELRRFTEWVAHISADIPVHFSRFFPMYRMQNMPPTPVKTLVKAYKIAKEAGLEFVYLGNTWDPKYESTYCPSCGALLIDRRYYSTRLVNLGNDGHCKKCGRKVNVIMR